MKRKTHDNPHIKHLKKQSCQTASALLSAQTFVDNSCLENFKANPHDTQLSASLEIIYILDMVCSSMKMWISRLTNNIQNDILNDLITPSFRKLSSIYFTCFDLFKRVSLIEDHILRNGMSKLSRLVKHILKKSNERTNRTVTS